MVKRSAIRKWLYLALASMLLVLSACGVAKKSADDGAVSSGSSNTPAVGSESGGNSPAAGSSEKVKITFLQPGLEQPNLKKPVEEMIQRFHEKHPNIEVELQSVGWDTAYQKLVAGFSNKDAPDVIYGGTRWMTAFAAMEGIMPLDEYAKDHMTLYHDTLQEAVKYKGKIYAVPRAFSARALIYRSDLIKEPPKTWDELVEVAKKVQSENPGMFGFGIAGAKHVSTTDQFFNYLFQNGGDVFDAQGNTVLNSKEGIEALQFYADLYTKHKVVPNPVEYNREQLPILFKEGKIAMFVSGPWAKPIMGIEPDNDKTPFKTAVLPKGKVISNVLVSDSLMISANSKHPKEAWTFIEFMTSLEEQSKYDKDRGLLPIQKEEMKDPYYSENEYIVPFVQMVNQGKPQPKPAIWEPFQEIITTAVQQALSGEDPAAVLNQAVDKIKQQKLEVK